MFLRSKVALLRKEARQSELSTGENDIFTRLPLAKVRDSRSKVRFRRAAREEKLGGKEANRRGWILRGGGNGSAVEPQSEMVTRKADVKAFAKSEAFTQILRTARITGSAVCVAHVESDENYTVFKDQGRASKNRHKAHPVSW